MTSSLKSTKYIYINDSKPRCKYYLVVKIMLNNLDKIVKSKS